MHPKEVTPPNQPAIHFACAANDHCTCVWLFNEVQQIIPTLLSLGTNNRCTLSLNKTTKFSQNIGCVGAGGDSHKFLYPMKFPIPTPQDGMLSLNDENRMLLSLREIAWWVCL